MKARILSVLMAIVVSAGMLLSGAMNAGAQELYFFEIQAGGKAIEADTDASAPPPPVFAENKHTLQNITIYGLYVRESRVLILAFKIQSSGAWATTGFQVFETEKSLLPIIGNVFPIYIDWVNAADVQIYGNGNFVIQFKEKAGVITSARLKSLGMGYLQLIPKAPSGATIRVGTLKMKGKQIDQADVPPAVLTAFGL